MTKIIFMFVLMFGLTACGTLTEKNTAPSLLDQSSSLPVPTTTRLDQQLSCLSRVIDAPSSLKDILFVVNANRDRQGELLTSKNIMEFPGRTDGHILAALNQLRVPLSCSLAIGCDLQNLVKVHQPREIIYLTSMTSGYEWTQGSGGHGWGFNLFNYLVGSASKTNTYDLLMAELIATDSMGRALDVQSMSVQFNDKSQSMSMDFIDDATAKYSHEQKTISGRSQSQREAIQASLYSTLVGYLNLQNHARAACITHHTDAKQVRQKLLHQYENMSQKERVRKIQTMLNWVGLYQGKCDGITGPRTLAALSRWQKTLGMPENNSASKSAFLSLWARMPNQMAQDLDDYKCRSGAA